MPFPHRVVACFFFSVSAIQPSTRICPRLLARSRAIIDLYMLWQQLVAGKPCDFRDAVKDLARILLK